MYDYNKIMDYLNTKYIGRTFVQYEEIKSLSNKAKHVSSNCPEGMVVLTEKQTNSKFKTLHSKTKQHCRVILGIILKSNLDSLYNILNIVTASVSKSFDELKLENKMKYPDIILFDNYEISHMLCEKIIRKNNVNNIIVQIYVDIPILEKNTTVENSCDEVLDREKLIAYILNYFEQYYNELKNDNSVDNVLNICRKKSMLMNQYVEINKIGRKTIKKVRVLDIIKNGELVIENNKEEKEVISLNEFSVNIVEE